MGNIIIIAILLIVVALAARSALGHYKGGGGCCGGGGETLPEKEKILENPVIGKKIMHIEGMHCVNCKNLIERQINRIAGASCQVDLKKKIAVVSYDCELDEAELKRTVERQDYKVTEIETVKA